MFYQRCKTVGGGYYYLNLNLNLNLNPNQSRNQSASSDDFTILYDEVNNLLCRDIDVRTIVTDKLV